MSRRLATIVVLTGLVTAFHPTSAQAQPGVVQFLEYALKVVVARLIEKGVDAIWNTGNEEVRELRAELRRLRHAVEDLTARAEAERLRCSDREAVHYVRCIIDLIRRAREQGRISDRQADELARMLLDAFAMDRGAPSFPSRPDREAAGGRAVVGGGGDKIESRAIGPGMYCMRLTRPDGSTRIGMVRSGGGEGEWIELTSGLEAASMVVFRNGQIDSQRSLTRRPLRPDRKKAYARRVMFTTLGASQLAHGTGVTVYYGKRDPAQVTMYYGAYVEGRRHGPGCYFGDISVYPYCYQRDLRVRLPERGGRLNLSLCRTGKA